MYRQPYRLVILRLICITHSICLYLYCLNQTTSHTLWFGIFHSVCFLILRLLILPQQFLFHLFESSQFSRLRLNIGLVWSWIVSIVKWMGLIEWCNATSHCIWWWRHYIYLVWNLAICRAYVSISIVSSTSTLHDLMLSRMSCYLILITLNWMYFLLGQESTCFLCYCHSLIVWFFS